MPIHAVTTDCQTGSDLSITLFSCVRFGVPIHAVAAALHDMGNIRYVLALGFRETPSRYFTSLGSGL